MMRTGRRYAVIIILIVAAILTPSPDVISQMILATPLYVLYEMSIAVSARVSKKLEKERKIEEADLEAREKAILERQKMIE